MKVLKLLWLISTAVLVNSCGEETNQQKEKVQFILGLNETRNTGGKIASPSEIPLGATLRLSIETNSGLIILSFVEVELLHIGGSVITAPLELIPGAYKITDFMIINETDEILFATPRRGSMYEKYVINPLDVDFVVNSGAVRTLQMEVMDVTQSTPEAFGYVSFTIDVVHPLNVAVFAATMNGPKLTEAKLTFEKDAPLLQTTNLAAQINRVGFKLDPDETYIMRISKQGFLAYERQVSYSSLIQELNGGTLNVTLQPGMTIITPFYTMNRSLNFYLSDATGTGFSINWGDGTIEENITDFNHEYASGKRYTIHISGDLANARVLTGFYNDANFEEFDLSLLSGLIEFELALALTPKVIDLSQCKRLRKLHVFECRGTERIIAPTSPNLEDISISGSRLSTTEVSLLIENIYANSIANEISYGQLGLLYTSIPGEPGDDQLAGPPNEVALQKLQVLRDSYGWEITPIDF
ncbi:MAG TPA: hypothetical protein VD884_02415 [Ohtaekwangia sp.]|nr:hypothetical protein [Ohtaekwangia sp.]